MKNAGRCNKFMTNTSIFVGEDLLRIENENKLFHLKVNKIYLWQYVRYMCLTYILEEITGVKLTSEIRKPMPVCSGQKAADLDWIKKQQFLVHKKDVLVFNHPRRIKEGKYYKCFVTDLILENMDYSYYVYENSYNGQHYIPVKTKHLKYIDFDLIKRIFKYDDKKYKKHLIAFIKKIVSIFERDLHVKFSRNLINKIQSYILNAYKDIFYYKIWAKIVLNLIKPKLVIVTVAYSLFMQIIVAEAKKARIPTIELQHGRIGNTHLAYNYMYNGKIESFADYMFVYGDYEKRIPRFPIDNDHIIAVGYPELEKKAKIYAKYKKNNDIKVITFISGPGEEGKTVIKYALRLRESQELRNYRIICKLHPSEYAVWKIIHPELENSTVETVADNINDIYYYLGQSDFVVGISSTALFEATEFNTSIFIIKENDFRKAEYLYTNNNATLVEDTNHLIRGIKNEIKKKQKQKKDGYFKLNSINNIRIQITDILNKN